MSIHRSGGGGCSCGDGTLSQVGLVHDGGQQRSIRCCAAFLNDDAPAVVYRGTDSRKRKGFPRCGGLAQG